MRNRSANWGSKTKVPHMQENCQQALLPEQQRFLLGDCVQAYLPLDEAQRHEFERLVATEPYRGVEAMNKTSFDLGHEQGVEQGLKQGRDQERRQLLREQLEDRFGPLSPQVQEQLRQWPAERLAPLVKRILDAQSLRELGFEDDATPDPAQDAPANTLTTTGE